MSEDIKELLDDFILHHSYFFKNKKITANTIEEIKFIISSYLYECGIESDNPEFLYVMELLDSLDILDFSDESLIYNSLGEKLIEFISSKNNGLKLEMTKKI